MKKELIKTEITVNNKIGILRIGDTDYISLTQSTLILQILLML